MFALAACGEVAASEPMSEAAPQTPDVAFEAADLEVSGEVAGVAVYGGVIVLEEAYITARATLPARGHTAPTLSLHADKTAHGSVFQDDGEVYYRADEGYAGADSFEYVLSVENEATGEVLTDTGTVTLSVE